MLSIVCKTMSLLNLEVGHNANILFVNPKSSLVKHLVHLMKTCINLISSTLQVTVLPKNDCLKYYAICLATLPEYRCCIQRLDVLLSTPQLYQELPLGPWHDLC